MTQVNKHIIKHSKIKVKTGKCRQCRNDTCIRHRPLTGRYEKRICAYRLCNNTFLPNTKKQIYCHPNHTIYESVLRRYGSFANAQKKQFKYIPVENQ